MYTRIGYGNFTDKLIARVARAVATNAPALIMGDPGAGKITLSRLIGDLRGGAMRAPHYSCSHAGLFGTKDRPGEWQLANGGVLILDDAPEFRASVLEYAANLSTRKDAPYLVLTATPCACGRTYTCACNDYLRVSWPARIRKLREHFPTMIQINVRGAVDLNGQPYTALA